MKIISNFCSEDMFEKIYNSRKETLLLEREVKIMKSDMVSNGIAEKWAESIGDSFYNALKNTQDSAICLPNNFRIVEGNIETFDKEVEKNLKDSSDVIKDQNSSIGALLEELQEFNKIFEDEQDTISNEEIGELVYRFILRDKVIHKDEGSFKEKKINKLKKVSKVPEKDVIFLMHDDTVLGSGKEGYVITNTGIYSKGVLSPEIYISWEEFVKGDLKKEKDYELKLNGKKSICHIVGGTEKNYVINNFFFELQKFLQENMNLER